MKNLSKKFESLTAFSAWLDTSPVLGYFAESNHLSSADQSDERKEFTHTDSFEDAKKLMLGGWHAGAKRVAAFMAAGGVRGRQDQPQNFYSPVGFAPSVGRYLAGHPCNMINRKKVLTPSPIVTIFYNICVSYNISSSSMEKAAAKLFNVIAGLEARGVRVNLWVGMINHYLNSAVDCAVKIKSAGQPFNLLKMVYPVVHPSFFRRHLFAFIERAGVSNDRGWHGYGKVTRNKIDIAAAVAALNIQAKNIISYYDIEHKTEKEINDMIK